LHLIKHYAKCISIRTTGSLKAHITLLIAKNEIKGFFIFPDQKALWNSGEPVVECIWWII